MLLTTAVRCVHCIAITDPSFFTCHRQSSFLRATEMPRTRSEGSATFGRCQSLPDPIFHLRLWGAQSRIRRIHDCPAKNRCRPHTTLGRHCQAAPQSRELKAQSDDHSGRGGLVAPFLLGDRGSRGPKWCKAVRVCSEFELLWILHFM